MNSGAFEESDQAFWRTKLKSETLLEAVCALDPLAQIALYLRYWEVCTIAEIATLLLLDWSVVDQMLEESILVLRTKLGPIGEALSKPQLNAS